MNGSDAMKVHTALAPGRPYSVSDLSVITQLHPRQVAQALRDLVDLGVVEVDGQGFYRRLIKSHIRQPGERPPCRGGRQWKLEHKRKHEQADPMDPVDQQVTGTRHQPGPGRGVGSND